MTEYRTGRELRNSHIAHSWDLHNLNKPCRACGLTCTPLHCCGHVITKRNKGGFPCIPLPHFPSPLGPTMAPLAALYKPPPIFPLQLGGGGRHPGLFRPLWQGWELSTGAFSKCNMCPPTRIPLDSCRHTAQPSPSKQLCIPRNVLPMFVTNNPFRPVAGILGKHSNNYAGRPAKPNQAPLCHEFHNEHPSCRVHRVPLDCVCISMCLVAVLCDMCLYIIHVL